VPPNWPLNGVPPLALPPCALVLDFFPPTPFARVAFETVLFFADRSFSLAMIGFPGWGAVTCRYSTRDDLLPSPAFPKFTNGIASSVLCIPPLVVHNADMSSTLSSVSTDAEVWASYDDNASYQEDSSQSKASAFITACRILARRLPISAARDGQSVSRESLRQEAAEANAWLAANPGSSGSGSLRVRFGDLKDFRD
jgi:hypothetical protein